ncbi:MAG: hypothetical protein QXU18_03900, partial [Thermoplasmatales archaeon]
FRHGVNPHLNYFLVLSQSAMNIPIATLKYFNTYGIGENSKGNYSGVIWNFVNDIMKRKTRDIQWRKAEKVFDVC